MTLAVKICGLNDVPAVEAVIAGQAAYAGFVFYEKSPRFLTPARAKRLVDLLPASIRSVGLFVDPSDEELHATCATLRLDLIQLHGRETPDRIKEIKERFERPIIKAVSIASQADIAGVARYEESADIYLLDAKALHPSLPGGNGRAFDWNFLTNASFARPWMLAGGLTVDLLEIAVRAGARILDVSSGVEDAPGRKNPAKIKAFLARARQFETSY